LVDPIAIHVVEEILFSSSGEGTTSMKRHVFLIPGFFGFANLGDFTYWGHVNDKLGELFDEAGMPARIHSVKSLPTASLATSLEIGFDPIEQAQQAFYYGLYSLATGYDFPEPATPYKRALKKLFAEVSDSDANDGIVPTLSQPWGRCIAVAKADHLDIIGHFHGEAEDNGHYDWLTTRSYCRSADFHDVWQRVVDFMVEAEGGISVSRAKVAYLSVGP